MGTGAHIRGIPPHVLQAMKIECVELDLTLGQLVTHMWRTWFDSPRRAEFVADHKRRIPNG